MPSVRQILIGALFFCLAFSRFPTPSAVSEVQGVIHSRIGPIADADVGWRGETLRVKTNAHGRFWLPASPHTKTLIAFKAGYRVGSITRIDSGPLSLQLDSLSDKNRDDYEWIDPHANPAKPNNCANCHGEIYREWLGSAHARSATNPKFLSLYDGGPLEFDNQGHVLSPPEKWNVLKENPNGSDVCALCHAPTLTAAKPYFDRGIRIANGVHRESGVHRVGVHCDMCHKVNDVPTGKFGTRFGRDALDFFLPPKNDPITFGPLDDAVRKGESFAQRPIYKRSEYCASCHEGVVFGVHAYSTYSEWLDSPAKKQGKQCQDCHMKPTGTMTNIAPGKGGIERDPLTLASHHTPGGDLQMLRRAVSLTMKASDGPRGRRVEIDVIATNVGHRVPTGFPERQVILVVTATGDDGQALRAIDGPRLPRSTGKWSGASGSLYAKELIDDRGHSPIPFWLHVDKVRDTRLIPERAERSVFLFPPHSQVTAQIWYRRFWQEVADSRAWKDNDLLVAETTAK
jgi:hypothetical protein